MSIDEVRNKPEPQREQKDIATQSEDGQLVAGDQHACYAEAKDRQSDRRPAAVTSAENRMQPSIARGPLLA